MKRLTSLLLTLLACCVPYRPQPISVEENANTLIARSLDGAAVRDALAKNDAAAEWPPRRWTRTQLTLAALALHPDLDVARAGLAAARASIREAAERPNPTLSAGVERLSGSDVSPWVTTLSLDIPFETAGKRGARVTQAQALTAEAVANVDQAIWTVRSGVARALNDLARSSALRTLRERETALREEIVSIYTKRLEVGESATPELARVRAELRVAHAATLAEEARIEIARDALAGAIGIPRSALPAEIDLATAPAAPRDDATLATLALTARPDVLAALARYEAADAAYRLEVKRQYPDVHLSPGLGWDQGAFKWTLGAAAELPIFNRHQGAIARTEAERERAAAELLAVQARILTALDQARTRERTARARLDAATRVVESRDALLAAARRQFEAGEIDRLALRTQELESAAAAADREDARYDIAAAQVELEAAVEQPLGN
jgi:cobalt-zinc-cadmium efflux system outer membrane protein